MILLILSIGIQKIEKQGFNKTYERKKKEKHPYESF